MTTKIDGESRHELQPSLKVQRRSIVRAGSGPSVWAVDLYSTGRCVVGVLLLLPWGQLVHG